MRTRSITFMLSLVMLAFAHPALATWNAGTGNPVSTATGNQLVSQLLPDGSQGTFVVWVDDRAGNRDIYAQRMTREGTVASGWPTNGVALCTAGGDQDFPVIASGAGGLIIAWQDHRGSTWDIYAQKIGPTGAVQWPVNGVPVSTLTQDQKKPSIASDGVGGCYIAWEDGWAFHDDISAQHLTSAGGIALGWSQDGLLICIAQGFQLEPSVAAGTDGGVYISWLDGRSGSGAYSVYGSRVNADGTTYWPFNGVQFCDFANNQSELSSVSDGSNGVIVTFTVDGSALYGKGVYAQRVNAAGTRLWGSAAQVTDAIHDQSSPRLVSDGAGGAFFTWRDLYSGQPEIWAARLNGSGQPASPGWPRTVVSTRCGDHSDPTIVADMAGGVFIGWLVSGYTTCGPTFLKPYVQRMTANGQVATGWPANGLEPAPSSPRLYSGWPRIASDGEGGVFVAWSQSPTSSNYDAYLQRFTGSGIRAPEVIPPAAVSDLVAYNGCQTITVTWTAPADDGGSQPVVAYRLYRNTSPGPGGALVSTPTPSSPGSAESVDDHVGWCSVPLYYFLYSQDECGNWSAVSNTGGPARTRCPPGGCTDLAPASAPTATFRCLPNPARGQVLFGYAVPNELAGQREIIAIYDLAGRRVAIVSDGPARPGAREIHWDMRSESGGKVAAGVYFARLTLGQKTVSRVIVFLK